MSAITGRMGIGDEIRELKLGRTLTSREPNLAFHTIRCKSNLFQFICLNQSLI